MMDDQDWLAERFEANRAHLRGVAFRMLGSVTEADDAVQEAWIRLSRTDTSDVENLRAWLTTVVGRVCLNMLRSRKTRREPSLETHLPDPILSPESGVDPEQEALLGDSVGLALLVVARRADARRTCRVRAARRLRRAVRPDRPDRRPHADRGEAARESCPPTRPGRTRSRRRSRWSMARRRRLPRGCACGDFERLLAVLDPDVVLRSDGGVGASGSDLAGPRRRGRRRTGDGLPPFTESATRVLVNGIPGGVAWAPDGSPFAVLAVTVRAGRIVAIDILADPDRLGQLDLTVVAG